MLALLLLFCDISFSQNLTQTLTFSSANIQTTTIDDYQMVNIDDLKPLYGEEYAGQPQLPLKHFNLLLPSGAYVTDISITITDEEQLSGDYTIYPVQMPLYLDEVDTPEFVEPDASIYNSDTPYPSSQVFEFTTQGYRDYNYVHISYSPFRYLPLSEQLYLITSATLTINYTITENNQEQKERPYNAIDEMAYSQIQNVVSNVAQLSAYYPTTLSKINLYKAAKSTTTGRAYTPTELPAIEGSEVSYVIITNNTDVFGNTVGDFTTQFQQFANWKTQSGTPAKVITVDAIRANYAGVDIAEQIREFIKDAHRLWGTEYILLGGNASIIPVRWIGGDDMPTDLYYSAIWHPTNGYNDNWNYNGDIIFGRGTTSNYDWCDFTPDIAVGRAPVDTDDEVDLFLTKNFTYARCSYATNIPDGAWLNKQLNIGGIVYERNWPTNDPGTNSLGLPTFWYIEDNFADNSEQYTMLEVMSGWATSHPDWQQAYDIMDAAVEHSAVINKIAEKPGIIFHIDHSGPNGMGLNCVTNTTKHLRSTDWNGLTNNYKYPFLIGGGCHTAPIEKDSYIGESWITAPGGGVAFLGTSKSIGTTTSYSYHQNLFSELYNNNCYILGNLMSIPASDNIKKQIFQLLGDPELRLYTDVPVAISVAHSSTITTGNTDYSVSVSGFPSGEVVTVCLYKENEVLAYTETNSSGEATLNITPDTPGTMNLTVLCHNAEPYEATITVTQNNSVHLYQKSVTVNDENSNGIIEPGETVNLTIQLANTGSITATGISATISTTDDYIKISQNTSTYSNIATNGTGNSLASFTFIAGIDDWYPGKALDFELNIDTDQGTFKDQIVLNLKAAELDLGNRITLVGGTETNSFSAGNVVNLYLEINNYGSVSAKDLTAVLSSALSSNIASVSTSTQNYGDIENESVHTNTSPFVITIGSSYTNQDLLFTLELTDAYNTSTTFEFNLNEQLPNEITGIDYAAHEQDITLTWDNVSNISGYNIYRSLTESGIYEKVNNFLISGSSIYFDAKVDKLTEYFYKISAVSLTGNERNIDNLTPVHAWTSLARHGSYPVEISTSFAQEALTTPIVYDVNNDGNKEIFLNAHLHGESGRILAYYENGQELFNTDGNETVETGFASTYNEIWASPAVMDVNNDGYGDIICVTRDNYSPSTSGLLYGFSVLDENVDNNPDLLWDEPIQLTHQLMAPPVISDIDNNGTNEIIVLDERRNLYVYNGDGELINGWIVGEWYTTWYSMGNILVTDLDGDGIKEIVVGIWEKESSDDSQNYGSLYVYNSDGTDFNSTNPFYTRNGTVETRMDYYPIAADINNDGYKEIIITLSSSEVQLLSLRVDGGIDMNLAFSDLELMPRSKPVVGDLDNDGVLEIVLQGRSEIFIIDWNGNILYTIPIPSNTSTNAPIVADIDGDIENEIIVVIENVIYAFDPDGSECIGWRLMADNNLNFSGSPFIDDINNDGFNEVVASTSDAKIYVWETQGSSGRIQWGSSRHDAQNTGDYNLSADCSFSSSGSIEVNESETWSFNKFIRGNLTIKSGATLTVNSLVNFAENSTIIIESGGELILDGGTFSSYCYNWEGLTINGTFTYKSGNISNYNSLINNGTMKIECDAEFDLPANVEFATNGELVISNNVQIFGNGLVTLNGTISAYTDATLTLQGSSKSTNFIEVASEVQFDENFSSVSIQNCKIVMDNSASELYFNSGIGEVIINNVLVTSSSGSRNSHKGIDIRCNNFSVTNSDFKNGFYGLYIDKDFTSTSMDILNNVFYNNSRALHVIGGSCNISDNQIYQNYFGLILVDGVQFSLGGNEYLSNDVGMNTVNSSFTMTGDVFTNNSIVGQWNIDLSGTSYLNMCDFYENGLGDSYTYNPNLYIVDPIYIQGGIVNTGYNEGLLQVNSGEFLYNEPQAINVIETWCDLDCIYVEAPDNNAITIDDGCIYSTNANFENVEIGFYGVGNASYGNELNISDGGNKFTANQFSVYGEFMFIGSYGMTNPDTYTANGNMWKDAGNGPIQGYDYELYDGGVIYDYYPLTSYDPICGYTLKSATIKNESDNDKSSKLKNYSKYYSTLLKKDDFTLNDTNYIAMKHLLSDFGAEIHDMDSLKQLAIMLHSIQKKKFKPNAHKKASFVNLCIDAAKPLIFMGKFDEALHMLDSVKNLLLVDKQYRIDRAICQIQARKDYIDSDFELDFFDAISLCTETSRKSGSVTLGEESNTNVNSVINFDIYPLPVSDGSIIKIENIENEGILEIFNLAGVKVLSVHVNNTCFEFEISNQQLKAGTYIVNLKVGDETIQTKKMVVVE